MVLYCYGLEDYTRISAEACVDCELCVWYAGVHLTNAASDTNLTSDLEQRENTSKSSTYLSEILI